VTSASIRVGLVHLQNPLRATTINPRSTPGLAAGDRLSAPLLVGAVGQLSFLFACCISILTARSDMPCIPLVDGVASTGRAALVTTSSSAASRWANGVEIVEAPTILMCGPDVL
jgi:hypothetical protein